MLSTRYKCIFVRVSKVASTSILSAFKAKKRIFDRGSYFAERHDTIAFYRDSFPRQFEKYFKFAFVRNPWDRIYSQYRYLRYKRKEEIADCSFETWLYRNEEALGTPEKFLFGRNREIFIHHLTDQLGWVVMDDKVAVDFIGRYESLENDFAYVCERLNAKIELPKLNKSKRPADPDGYKSVYNTRMIELVAEWHSRDIDYFDYKF